MKAFGQLLIEIDDQIGPVFAESFGEQRLRVEQVVGTNAARKRSPASLSASAIVAPFFPPFSSKDRIGQIGIDSVEQILVCRSSGHLEVSHHRVNSFSIPPSII